MGVVITSILLALVALSPPRVPGEADTDTAADASWSAVLGFAHQHGLQFGKDVVFTYGPLGFLATPYATGNSIGLRLLTDVVLSLVVGSGLALLAWRLGAAWKFLLLATSIFLLANIPFRTDLLIELGVICWGLITLVESGRKLALAGFIFVGISVCAALVKITLLFLAVLSIGGVGLDLLLRRRRIMAAAIVFGFAIAFVLGWMGLGQEASHLGTFISHAL